MSREFRKLADEYAGRVYTFALYSLRRREDAEDVTQEVLIRLWRHRDTIAAEHTGAWVMRVARNLAALFHPLLSPNVGGVLRITQQELGYLVGLSRQRVNEALALMQDQGSVRVEYGGLRVLDLESLRRGIPPRRQPPAV